MKGHVTTDVRRSKQPGDEEVLALVGKGRRLGAGGRVEPLVRRGGRPSYEEVLALGRSGTEAGGRHKFGVAGIREGRRAVHCVSGFGSTRSRADAPRGGRAGGGLAALWSQRVTAVFPIWIFFVILPFFLYVLFLRIIFRGKILYT